MRRADDSVVPLLSLTTFTRESGGTDDAAEAENFLRGQPEWHALLICLFNVIASNQEAAAGLGFSQNATQG